MVRKVFVLAVVGLLLGAVPAAAGGPGTVYRVNLKTFGPPLSDEVLDGVRGGFMGLAFSVFFTGFVANTGGDTAGNLTVSTSSPSTLDGLTTSNNTTLGDQAQVRIATISGSAFGASSGFFQIVQVPGSNNVVVTTLNVQVVLVNVPSTAAIPSFLNLFR